MNVDLNLSSMYSLIRGTTSEIQRLECTLRRWSAQYDRNGEGRDVFLRDGDCLFVLTGAMIALIERGDFRKENFFTEAPPVNLAYQAGCLREAELLRSYQAAACVAALGAHWRRGIIEAPTGAGKTRIAAGIIALGILHGVSHWVYLVQNRNLALQSSKSFEELVPKMLLCLYQSEPGHRPMPNYKVGCGSYGTVQPDILASAGGLIVDECFPAGTMVGNREIQNVKVGDLVPSFDEHTRKIIQGRVTRVFKNPAPDELVHIKTSVGPLVCTLDHPIYTQDGWKPAGSLDSRDSMLYTLVLQEGGEHENKTSQRQHLRQVQCQDAEKTSADRSGVVLRPLQTHSQGGEAKGCDPPMPPLQKASSSLGKSRLGCSKEKPSILLQGAQTTVSARFQSRAGTKVGYTDGCMGFKEDAGRGEPNARPKNKRSGGGEEQGERVAEGHRKRGERATSTSPTKVTSLQAGVGDGSSNSNRGEKRDRVSYLLQSGHSQYNPQDSSGDRWSESWDERKKEAGQEERTILIWTRVDSAEVHEQAGRQGSGEMHRDNFVYNLKVEGTGTYVAGGFVVHNCHGFSARTRMQAVAPCRAHIRIGMSATPLLRQDAGNALVAGVFGPVVYKIGMEVLQKAGHLAKGKVTTLEVNHGG